MAKDKPIVFFDGLCNLCNSSVDFLIRRDKTRKLHFASLQGETARKLLPESDQKNLHSIVLYRSGKMFYRSAAIFEIARILKGALVLLMPFQLLPRRLTDGVYQWVAKNRYQWFGKRQSCRLPSKDEAEQFLG